MRHAFINKVAMTTVKVSDNDPDVARSICPDRMMVFSNKLYDTSRVRNTLRAKGCASGIFEKNNRKDKSFDLDRWRSSIWTPHENTFSRLNKFAR